MARETFLTVKEIKKIKINIYIERKKSHRRYGSEVAAAAAESIHTTLTPARARTTDGGPGGMATAVIRAIST